MSRRQTDSFAARRGRMPVTTLAQTTPLALHEAARRHGDAPAVGDGDTRLSWSQLLDSVRETARALIARGIERGDRFGIWTPNTHHYVPALLDALPPGAPI